MNMRGAGLERIAFYLLASSLGLVLFSLFAAQLAFTIAAFLWLVITVRDGRRPPLPTFARPLAIYALLTLISSAASLDPIASLADSRQLLLFLMVPMVARLARGSRAARTIDVVIALGAVGALVGIVQYAVFGFDNLGNRPVGALSHYMTYSGVLMLVTSAAVARLLFYRRQWIWPGIAVPALVVALAVTLTRNAWVGTFAAVASLLALRQWRLVFLAPVLAVLFVTLAPDDIRSRALSMVDLSDPTNLDRRAMLVVGAGMVRDHPLFGVGPEMVERVYADYRPAYGVNETNPHLHNVPVQIAAERGLPALLAWLVFVVVAGHDLARRVWRRRSPAVAAAGLAALIAMATAGLFEYNFGDSEFLMLFLGLLTLPFAAEQPDLDSPATATASDG
jgi:O-antigen ligase